ncbi:MAG: oligoendopeptidase F [candidate division KSB1 bacterium]|nr:oligoendopeptidase F [candidate division KSB1 bacterium]
MKTLTGIAMILSVLCMSQNLSAQTRERKDIDKAYTWNLTDIYESDAAWQDAKQELAAEMDKITKFEGKLSSSAQTLLQCLEFSSKLDKDLTRLYVYAMQKSDLDTRVSEYQAMKQELEQLATQMGSMASYIEPEILKMDSSQILNFINQKKKLKVYAFYLKDLLRKKEHRLSQKEEKIMAEAGLLTGGPQHIYSILSNADLPYPTVTLSDGTEAKLNAAGYARYRSSKNRSDRELVFNSFFTAMKDFSSTFGASLAGNIKTDLFNMRARNYESCLQAALDRNNIPTEVYTSLINNVTANLESFHRYLDIKRRMLGVDTLKYSDLYAPTVKNVDLEYSYDKGREIVLESLAPLGDEYLSTVRQAMDERWIDVYPTPGKRSGAYSSGNAYDVHPFILLNYNDQYSDVSTLTHELGHTMHSFYSNKTQPYPLADYSIFVAEVASTFNEALLTEYMLDKIKDDDTRLSLLMEYLDGLKGTVFRQTQFAEFELKIHEQAENGQALTGESLTQLYADIVRNYYGHDKGVCNVKDLYTYEWAYIPHFYYNFYVYQYSTSFCASTALSEKVLAEEQGALSKYIQFISSGGSDYPIELLKAAGVDMTTSEPFDKTMQKMNRVMDEIESILEKKGI